MRGEYVWHILDQLETRSPNEIIDRLLLEERGQSGIALAKTQAHLGLCFSGVIEGEEDYAKSARYFKASAMGDDPVGINGWGDALYFGQGVERNVDQGCHWYHRASDAGVVTANIRLREHYARMLDEYGPEVDRSVRFHTNGAMESCLDWWKTCYESCKFLISKPIDQFHGTDAAYQIGRCFELGCGVEQSSKQALEWFLRSAEDECPHACLKLNTYYKKGIGVKVDAQKAFDWAQSGVDAGGEYLSLDIQGSLYSELGKSYYHGEGVGQNYKQAFYWLRLAVGIQENNGSNEDLFDFGEY